MEELNQTAEGVVEKLKFSCKRVGSLAGVLDPMNILLGQF